MTEAEQQLVKLANAISAWIAPLEKPTLQGPSEEARATWKALREAYHEAAAWLKEHDL